MTTIEQPPRIAGDRGLSRFRPIRQRKAADEVVTAIVDAIQGGLYEPGDRLPRERDLAARLEVSRSVLREAITILHRAGIVSTRRGNQGGVCVETRWIPPQMIATLEGQSHAELRSLLEMRRVLERTGALLTIQRVSDEELDDMQRLVDLLSGLTEEPEEFIAVDFRFHSRFGELSGNPFLAEYLKDTIQRFMAVRAQYPVGHIDFARGIRNQQDTLAALRTRIPARVVQSLDNHLGSVEEYFLGERLQYK